MVAVVTLLRVLARMSSGGSKLSNVRSFITWRSGKGVTTFTKGNSANFSSENGKNEAFWGVYILRIGEKTLKTNLVLVVVLALESKGF